MHHFLYSVEELWNIKTLNGAGNHSEVRERRIASADAWQTVENVAKAIALGYFLHVRSWIGNCYKALRRFLRANCLLHLFEEILFENIRLERAARLAGHNENRLLHVELARKCPNLRWISRVEHENFRMAFDLAVRELQYFHAQA